MVRLPELEMLDLMNKHGVSSFMDLKAYRAVKILGQHFRSGEWGSKRCGSVVTTIIDDESRYCFVDRFFEIEGKGFALVTWVSVPTYPCEPNPLVVKVRFPPLNDVQPSRVLHVDDIVPTHVSVLPLNDGVHFLLMREKGTDRTSFTTL